MFHPLTCSVYLYWMFSIPNVSRFLSIIKMRLSIIFVALIFLSSTVQPKSLRSRIIKMRIRIPASEVSHAWKEMENLLSYIAFQIGRAHGKKMDRNPNLSKTAALIQPINDDPDKPQARKNTISNRWVRLWYLIKHIFLSLLTNLIDDSVQKYSRLVFLIPWHAYLVTMRQNNTQRPRIRDAAGFSYPGSLAVMWWA